MIYWLKICIDSGNYQKWDVTKRVIAKTKTETVIFKTKNNTITLKIKTIIVSVRQCLETHP